MKIRDKYDITGYASLNNFLSSRSFLLLQSLSNPFTKKIKTNNKYYFICGCGHSGTTLLANRLGQHTRALLIGRESDCFLPPRGHYASRAILKEWEYFASVEKKDIIVEKTPKHIHSIKRIKKLLPNSSIIVVVRNPLDTIASLYQRFSDLGVAVNRWVVDNSAALKWNQKDGVLLIKYEDLTAHPAKYLEYVASFGGMDWDSEILQSGQSGYAPAANEDPNMRLRAAQITQDISPNNGKWRDVFDMKTAEKIVSRTSKLAQALGYTHLYPKR